jgi:hypothetical protein
MVKPVPESEEFAALLRDLVPIVKRHLGATGEDVEYWAERLISHGLWHGFGSLVIDRPKDLAALKRIADALLQLKLALSDAAITPNTRGYLEEAIWFGPGVRNAWTNPLEGSEYAASGGREDLHALQRIAERCEVLRKAVAITIAEVKESPFSKRTLSQLNVEAIGLVDACRYVWLRCKGFEAPLKDLAQSSPFASFLADTMQACRIKGDPVSAFRAWVRVEASIHKSRQSI